MLLPIVMATDLRKIEAIGDSNLADREKAVGLQYNNSYGLLTRKNQG